MKPRRIILFLIGLLAGCALVYFTLIRGRNRDYWLPENRVKELVMKSDILWTGHAQCMMNCRNVSRDDVMGVLQTGEVNFSESNAKGASCPSYAIEGTLADNKQLRVVVTTCDSIAKIETAIVLGMEKDSCSCK